MPTLIVDNYDSFTYNLAQYCAELTGEVPTVITNDDPAWRPSDLERYDRIIISPGPGSPSVAADLGISREVIRCTQVPLLGVCLGHQAIAHEFGGVVSLAPEPRHGRLSQIMHDGTGVFAGLPSPMDVVRYHSLAVTSVPADLRVTAWTADGLVMGLQHVQRPITGVQFHPESICTENGHSLLGNFLAPSPITLTRPTDQAPELPPTPESASLPTLEPATRPTHRAARDTGRRDLRLVSVHLPMTVDTEAVFAEFYRDSETACWLDGETADLTVGRFSIMCDAGGPLARVASADTWSGKVTITGADSTTVLHRGFFDWLERDLARTALVAPELPFDFALGWVGYLGYELKAECGGRRAHRSEVPDAQLVFADRAIVVDRLAGDVHLLALTEATEPAASAANLAWLRTTADRLQGLPLRVATRTPGLLGDSELELRHDRDAYLDRIARCQEEIRQGETYEVCLTNRVSAPAPADPYGAYQELRRRHPAAYSAYLAFGDTHVLSTSPERFLRIDRGRVAQSKPIKGTRPRGRDFSEDVWLKAELQGNEKDRAENLMIVDLVRNDLGRTAEPGSVHVPKLFAVESFATVHQLVSTVESRLAAGATAVSCVRAAFPGGSMTGAPKVRTLQLIDLLEAGPRGVYSGAIGYFSLSGPVDLSIVIRTVVVADGVATYGVGGAIIALSDPAAEYEETAVKATPLLQLLGVAFPERDPEPAVPLPTPQRPVGSPRPSGLAVAS